MGKKDPDTSRGMNTMYDMSKQSYLDSQKSRVTTNTKSWARSIWNGITWVPRTGGSVIKGTVGFLGQCVYPEYSTTNVTGDPEKISLLPGQFPTNTKTPATTPTTEPTRKYVWSTAPVQPDTSKAEASSHCKQTCGSENTSCTKSWFTGNCSSNCQKTGMCTTSGCHTKRSRWSTFCSLFKFSTSVPCSEAEKNSTYSGRYMKEREPYTAACGLTTCTKGNECVTHQRGRLRSAWRATIRRDQAPDVVARTWTDTGKSVGSAFKWVGSSVKSVASSIWYSPYSLYKGIGNGVYAHRKAARDANNTTAALNARATATAQEEELQRSLEKQKHEHSVAKGPPRKKSVGFT